MEALPITFYLDRKSRKSGGGDPNPPGMQAATEASYKKGFAEGMEHAKAACDATIARKEQECKLLIAAARKSWSETEAASLAQQITGAASALKSEIADTAARILRPIVAQKLVDEALAKLANEIEKLLSHDDAIHLKISGSADLVSELRKQIPPHAIVTVLAGENPEVTVCADKTVIETRLSEWLARIGVDSHAHEQEG